MIGIIDYGLGNIKAFENIYRRLSIPVTVLRDESHFVEGISKLILPGVGAFDHAVSSFTASGMRGITEKKVLSEGLPIIGICVGMQMLAKSSEEGQLSGLGWVDAVVKRFDESRIRSDTHLPHMGWNDVIIDRSSSIFEGVSDRPQFYFLHSYYFACNDRTDIIGEADYGGRFACAIQHNNVFGVQFHPEKSHSPGVRVLENFARM